MKKNHNPSTKLKLGLILTYAVSLLVAASGTIPFIVPKLVDALSLSTLPQQITILNGEFMTTNSSDSPTDNSFGLIHFDPADYNGETVYFEAIIRCVACTGGGNNRVTASLYNDAGTSQVTINTNDSSYARVRSGSLSLSADDYTVRFARDDDAGTAYIKAARLIILQSGENITSTQTQIELGDMDSTSDSSAATLTNPKYYSYDNDQYSGTVTAEFEATLSTTATATTANAELYNRTDAAVVGNSTVSTNSTTYSRQRSGTLTTNFDTSSDDEYEVRFYTDNGLNSIDIINAKLVITQTDTNGLSNVQLIHPQITTTISETNTTYTQHSYYNEYDPGYFDTGGNELDAFFEATMRTTGSTGYAMLYNDTGSNMIDTPVTSELTTVDTGFERVTSNNLADNSDWPGEPQDFDTIIAASSGETTEVSSSWLILNWQAVAPSITFTISGVNTGQTFNGVTTTLTSDVTTLAFGNISVEDPEYLAHELNVVTNDASTQYTVDVRLESTFQGNYPANDIDPFAGSSATWSSPQTWSTPDGTDANDNTGWLGANIDDSDVSGWTSSSGKFGPIGTDSVEVMRGNSGNHDDTNHVSYGLEVNINQPADLYSTTLLYTLTPTF